MSKQAQTQKITLDEPISSKDEETVEDDKTTMERIVKFFEENSYLSLQNFENFLHETELSSVFQYDEIEKFWVVFTNTEELSTTYDFNSTLELVEKLGEKFAEHKQSIKLDEDNKAYLENISQSGSVVENIGETHSKEVKESSHSHNFQSISEILDTLYIEDITDFLTFMQVSVKSRDYIILDEIPGIMKKNKISLSEELVVSFLNRICHNHVGNILYLNMDLYKLAIQRLEQTLELHNLTKKNQFISAQENDSPKTLLDDAINLQEESNSQVLVIQNIAIDIKTLFDQLIQSYGKVISTDDSNEQLLEQIHLHLEETFTKIKEIEIYSKKLENLNISNIGKLNKFKEKFQIMEHYLDHDPAEKLFSTQSLVHVPVDGKKDNEYVNKLLRDIADLEEIQQNLDYDLDDLRKSEKEKENKIFELSEEINQNNLEMKKLRLEIDNINTKLNEVTKENEVLLKRTYKEVDQEKKKSLFKQKKHSNSVHNFENMLSRDKLEGTMDIHSRFNKLKKYSSEIEKQKKSLEDTIKKKEEEIREQRTLIYEQDAKIKSMKIQSKKDLSSKEMPRLPSKDIRRLSQPTNKSNPLLATRMSRNKDSKKEATDNDAEDGQISSRSKASASSPREERAKLKTEKQSQKKLLVIDGINIVEEGDDEDSNDEENKSILIKNNDQEKVHLKPNNDAKEVKQQTFESPKGIMRKSTYTIESPELELKSQMSLMDITSDEPEHLLTEVKKISAFDNIRDFSERKVDRVSTDDNAKTPEKKKMHHYRSLSSMSYAKNQSVFLMLNNEDDESNCSRIIKEVDEQQNKQEETYENFDLSEIKSYDFLFKKGEPYLKRLLDQDKNNDIFSDNIFLYDYNMTKSKIYFDMIINKKSIFLLNAGKDSLKSIFKLDNLFRITISNKNFNLLVLHFSQGDDLIVSTYRRTSFLSYLKKYYIIPNKREIKFYFSECIKIQIKYAIKDLIVSTTEQNYEYSTKIGWLSKYCIGIFKNTFIDKFAVLTNIGLLYFDEPGKIPKRLVPLAGCMVSKVDKNKYKQDFVFEIKSFPTEESFIFAARNQDDLNSWVEELIKFKAMFESKIASINLGCKFY